MAVPLALCCHFLLWFLICLLKQLHPEPHNPVGIIHLNPPPSPCGGGFKYNSVIQPVLAVAAVEQRVVCKEQNVQILPERRPKVTGDPMRL